MLPLRCIKIKQLNLDSNNLRKYFQVFQVSGFQIFKTGDLKVTKITWNKNPKVPLWCKRTMKILDISNFSVLLYTQNWKLGYLGKFSYASNLDISCNLRFKTTIINWDKNVKVAIWFTKKVKISEVSEFSISP